MYWIINFVSSVIYSVQGHIQEFVNCGGGEVINLVNVPEGNVYIYPWGRRVGGQLLIPPLPCIRPWFCIWFIFTIQWLETRENKVYTRIQLGAPAVSFASMVPGVNTLFFQNKNSHFLQKLIFFTAYTCKKGWKIFLKLERNLCHKLKFSYPKIFATWCCKPFIFQT